MCTSHGNGIDVFSVRRRRNLYCQSGGGEMVLASSMKVHGAGEVALVSKIHIFRLK